MEPAFGQLFGQARTQYAGPVQTENGIHWGIIDEMGDQLLCTVFRYAEAGLLEGDVYEIVDVGMIGGEVAAGDTEGSIPRRMGRCIRVIIEFASILFRIKIKKKAFTAPVPETLSFIITEECTKSE